MQIRNFISSLEVSPSSFGRFVIHGNIPTACTPNQNMSEGKEKRLKNNHLGQDLLFLGFKR
eukprot:753656-Hanusia_phi.AAC.5